MTIIVRSTQDEDHDVIHDLLVNRWTSPEMLLDGDLIDASQLPGFVAFEGDELVGLVTLIIRDDEWEILTLDSVNRWGGTGSKLLEAVIHDARIKGVKRVTVRTSNDNLDAFRFYQRRGFRLERVRPGVIDEERAKNPDIPLRGDYGIEIRDEILFARAV
ncbi:GNAT family N-acetyltransferase [Roseibium sediminis]|uniref:GNAT family N-acetyltransferase n=1 Tax=Roseibium sediminis TaxID=1775174 RepID=UPI00123D61A7|nr:GNAT family N-acetyltransferase [Roseibium sediminis]